MMPTEPDPIAAPPAAEIESGPVPVQRPRYRWYHKMMAVLFITFCLEVGFFLVIFPWTDYWGDNYFAVFQPLWAHWWDNLYVRGAVSGLGIVNLYVSFAEALRLRRFSQK